MAKSAASLMILCAFTAISGSSHAAIINANDLNIFRDFRADNDVGERQGDVFQFGGNIQGGSATTFLQGIFTPFGGSPQFLGSSTSCGPTSTNANLCSKSAPFTPARLNGAWQVQFRNSNGTVTDNLPSVTGIPLKPVNFPTSVTISPNASSPANPNGDPTINWTLPPGTNPNAFRVNVYDKSVIRANGNADIIESTNISNTATSFTPTVTLKPGGNYAIGFQVIDTRDGGSIPVGSGNADILSRSNSYFDFSPPNPGGPPVIALPSIDQTGVYHFNVGSVGPSSVTFIDPKIAIGYDYAIGAGNPDFASVILPSVGGGHFDVSFLQNGSTVKDPLNAGVQLFFGNGGVSAFEVTGIDPSARLDPTNGGAFVTGLTFVSAGPFTGTMTPITTSVPEPSTWALMFLGFAGLGFTTYRRAMKASEVPIVP